MSDVVLDAHVHFHPNYIADALLSGAAGNFDRAVDGQSARMLFLTESAGCNWFGSLAAPGDAIGSWQTESTGETCSLRLTHVQHPELYVVAGHQVVTSEGVEVLVVGTRDKPTDGDPAGTVIERALEQALIAIVPWGFGKWLFKRGSVVRGLVDRFGGGLFLGDNGGRLRYAPYPRLLREGQQAGCLILPGTDPLPWAGEEQRVGGFGAIIPGVLDAQLPFRSVKSLLKSHHPTPYGQAESLLRFIRHQTGMQVRRRITHV